MRGRGHVHGLTTAASLWAVASVGLALAYGRIVLAVVVAVLLFVLLAVPLKKWERERGLIEDRKSRV